jgi:DNA recombination protein RmuC
MSMESVALIVLAVALVIVVTWLLARARYHGLDAARHAAVARLETKLAEEQRRHHESRAVLVEAERRFREAFRALSAEALQQNNQAFLDLARTSLGQFQQAAAGDLEARQQAVTKLVQPIAQSLEAVQRQVGDLERQRIDAYAGLRQQLEGMAAAQEQLRKQTGSLVTALRAPTARGRWGEIQLRRVVELAGMLEHCDFVEQESVAAEGGRLRPDLLVQLPGGKVVVVDAKAPLQAYLEAAEAAGPDEREQKLKDHARQVRAHVDDLSSKAYWAQFSASPEFVVMFLPGEAFFSAALQHDPELIEFGVGKRVIPASPLTLIALLRAVSYGWQQERLAENAQAISDLGRELCQRLGVWSGHLKGLGDRLRQAVEAYNDAVGSLEGRVLVTARQFDGLGVPTPEELSGLAEVTEPVRRVREGEEGAVPEERGPEG